MGTSTRRLPDACLAAATTGPGSWPPAAPGILLAACGPRSSRAIRESCSVVGIARQWQTVLHQKALEFAELVLRGFLLLEAQRHPLQHINHRIQGGVALIRPTLARDQPRPGRGGHILLQHLYQARFADARFAAEQHDLLETLLDLRPALPKQSHFLLATHRA
jgi:hypothetical protein